MEHNGKPIKLSCGGVEVDAGILKVTKETVENPTLLSIEDSFDKNPAKQADIITEIKGLNDVLTVTDVKSAGISIGEGNYSVSKDSENKDILTIHKEYLAIQPVGDLTLTVEFTGGTSTYLTTHIKNAAPYWPVNSEISVLDRTLTSITLSWTAAQDDVAVTGYKIEVYRDDELIGTKLCTDTTCTFTGLSSGTEYSFRIQAQDGDGNESAILSRNVSTNPGSGITTLRLNASRYILYGSLYTGKKAVIELISTETGLEPKVIVNYNKWNGDSKIMEKSSPITLVEDEEFPGRYAADFPLTEGICEIVSLEGEALPGIVETYPVNQKVAGKVIVTVKPPDGLNHEQMDTFNKLLAGSFVVLYPQSGIGSSTSESTSQTTFVVEGLDEGDYNLKHYDSNSLLIYEAEDVISVKDGLETTFQYTLDNFSHIIVMVIDAKTGNPIEGAQVKSGMLTKMNGTRDYLSVKTGSDGYAVTSGSYFAKNLLKGFGVQLVVTHSANSSQVTDWYRDKTVTIDSLSLGENKIIIPMEKVPMVTLKGKVTGGEGNLLKNVFVSAPQKMADGQIIYATTQTDDKGEYSLRVMKPSDGNQCIVTFSRDDRKTEVRVNLSEVEEDEEKNLDVTMPAMKTPGVYVDVYIQDFNGNMIDAKSILPPEVINTANKRRGTPSSIGSSLHYLRGDPGDVIEVSAGGSDTDYSRVSETVELDSDSYAEVTLVVRPKGKINAMVTDQFGNAVSGVERHIAIYDAESGEYVTGASSTSPYILCTIPDGEYRAVFSWERGFWSRLSDWDRDHCFITDIIPVESGKSVSLGTIMVNRFSEGGYFSDTKANSFTSNRSIALPGSVITLRAAYDYGDTNSNKPEKLKLEAQIPPGTELIDKSIVNRYTRGSIDSINDENLIVGTSSITLDLTDGLKKEGGIAGILTFQVKVKDKIEYDNIMANARMHMEFASGERRSETIGAVILPTKMITLNAPSEIVKDAMGRQINLNGFAPAGNTVELYDGSIKIGEAKAASSGFWSAMVSLPDRGRLIYHQITAKTDVDGREQAATALILVGINKALMTEFSITEGRRVKKVYPGDGVSVFPFAYGLSNPIVASVTFRDGDSVENVKIAGMDTTRTGNSYPAIILPSVSDIIVQYDEDKDNDEKILKFDHGEAPDFIENADVEFVGGTADDISLEYDADGYIKTLSMPEVRLTALDGHATVRMELETVTFDTSKAKNRTDLGNGMYGYDFSYEKVGDKYVITAYLDKRLLPKSDDNSMKRMAALSASSAGLEFAKTTLDIASEGKSLMGAFGDLSKSAKMINLMNTYDWARMDMPPHLVEYYDNQIARMGKDILMGKTLGCVGEIATKAGKKVPLLGQVVIGIAGYISNKLLGDMFDKEFDSDYNRLMSELRNFPGVREQTEMHEGRWDYGDYWRNWSLVARTNWIRILDPSGFVYEGVEDNRIEGVTATALFLPRGEPTEDVPYAAPDIDDARASDKWQFWDAEFYMQENPQITNAEGRYAWDVPEGWWMVKFEKDGYQTAYSDALPVPPPQLDVNIPMVKLEKPSVEKTVWGSGGRYVDVYFSKYMDTRSLEAANSISIKDNNGNVTTGTVKYPVPEKKGVNDLSFTRVVRFVPDVPLTVGGVYTLTVNKAVADYAGFSMDNDYTTDPVTITDEALIASLAAIDITVEPWKDITQDVMNALTFTAVNSGDEGKLDRTSVLVSSNPDEAPRDLRLPTMSYWPAEKTILMHWQEQ